MKNKTKQNKKTPVWVAAVTAAALILLLLAAWIFVYDCENPVRIERCIRALNNGRGYEILEEDDRFITKLDDQSNLMQFLEGHYQMVFHTSYDNRAVFYRGKTKVVFTTSPIRFHFMIWERAKE